MEENKLKKKKMGEGRGEFLARLSVRLQTAAWFHNSMRRDCPDPARSDRADSAFL